MSTTWKYLLSGTDLGAWTVLAETPLHLPLTYRDNDVQVPGRDGSLLLPTQRLVEAPTMTVALAPAAKTPHEQEALLDQLYALIGQPGLTLTRWRPDPTMDPEEALTELLSTNPRETDDTDGLEIGEQPCEIVSLEPGEADTLGLWAELTLTLKLPTVYYRSRETFHYTCQNTPGWQAARGLESTAPIRDATVNVRGPLTKLELTDWASNTGISWTGELTNAQTLTIDLDRLTATITTDDSTETTSAIAGLDYPPAGKLTLWPTLAAPAPLLDLTTDGTDENTSVKITAKRAWR